MLESTNITVMDGTSTFGTLVASIFSFCKIQSECLMAGTALQFNEHWNLLFARWQLLIIHRAHSFFDMLSFVIGQIEIIIQTLIIPYFSEVHFRNKDEIRLRNVGRGISCTHHKSRQLAHHEAPEVIGFLLCVEESNIQIREGINLSGVYDVRSGH